MTKMHILNWYIFSLAMSACPGPSHFLKKIHVISPVNSNHPPCLANYILGTFCTHLFDITGMTHQLLNEHINAFINIVIMN